MIVHLQSKGCLLPSEWTTELTSSIAGSMELGPLDENLAIAGFEFTPKSVFPGLIDAGGFLFQ